MCGLLVFHDKKKSLGKDKSISLLKKASFIQEYRGQDETNYSSFGTFYFAHSRLKIIDGGSLSNQPVDRYEKLFLFNGTLYNYKDIEYSSKSDTETLLKAIISEEKNVFYGGYSYALFSKENQSLTISRDIYGEKPLYYFNNESYLVIASTVKAIKYFLEQIYKVLTEVDQQSINDFLLHGFIRSPRTIYKNIYSLEANSKMTFKLNNQVQKSRNSENFQPLTNNFDPDDLFLRSIDSSYSKFCNPKLFYSGGVDSSFLLSLIIKNRINIDLEAYLFDTNQYEEQNVTALKKSSLFGNGKINIHSSSDAKIYFSDILDKQIQYTEQPSSDGFNQIVLLDKMNKSLCSSRLIITGNGGDELFGGYSIFRYAKISNLVTSKITKLFPGKFNRFSYLSEIDANNLLKMHFLYRINFELAEKLVGFDSTIATFNRYEDLYRKYIFKNPIMTIKYLEIYDYLSNQILRDADSIGMHFNKEIRSPFLHPNLLGFIPDKKRIIKKQIKSNFGNLLNFKEKSGFKVKLSKRNTAFNDLKLDAYKEFGIKNLMPKSEERLIILNEWMKANNKLIK